MKIIINSYIKPVILCILFFIFFMGCKIDSGSSERKTVKYDFYTVLSENDDFMSSVVKPNTIYVIQHKYNLKGEKINIPDNCELSFTDSGELYNGQIFFSNTKLSGNPNFKNISVSGSINNNRVYLKWFDFTLDEEEENNNGKNSALLTELASCVNDQLIIGNYYPLSSSVVLKNDINLVSEDWKADYKSFSYNYSYVPVNGFYSVKDNTLFEIQNKSDLSLYGIKLKGMEQSECGIDGGWGNSVNVVYNCIIEGFKYGITVSGGYIEKIQNTTFNSCDYGIFAVYTSDFDVFGCRFTNCGLKYQDILSSLPEKITGNHISAMKETSAAVFAASTGMLDLNCNYFENNLISVMLSDDDVIFNLQKNYFKNPVFCDIFTLSCLNYVEPIIEPKYNPAIDCVTITNNIFEKSGIIGSKLGCVIFIREADDRGTNLVFADNVVKDLRTSVSDVECIFLISNSSDNTLNLVCHNNDFSESKSKTLINKLPSFTQDGVPEKEGSFNIVSNNL